MLLLLLDLMYFLSLEESDSLNGESDDDWSDSGSSGAYSFPNFSLRLENSVGSVGVLGYGIFVPTGVNSKWYFLVFNVFVPI